ncbi:MAG: ABC transporter substrate-binding protein, partial [Anaerolineae bacterium]|nr:ABC transporter substrate-binding protein [Anaerolineae bacterium]
ANLYEPPILQVLEPGEEEGVLLGIGEYGPGMADEITVDEETGLVTMHIQDGLKFANGNPLTAQSFKFMYDLQWLSPTSYTPVLFPFMGLAGPDAVQAVDDNTLEIQLEQLTPLSLAIMAFNPLGALDEETVKENATEDDPWAAEWLRRNASSSGPYVLTKWEQGVEYVFEPNPNYWQGEDYFQNSQVIVRVIPSPEDRELLLRQGDIDLALGLPYKNVDDLMDDPNVKVYPIEYTRLFYLGMNNKLAPFDNKALRQAISYAVPYDTLIEEVFYGYAQKATSPIPVGMPTHTDEFWPYDTDLTKAAEKLGEAGYADGLDVTLSVRASIPWDVEAATWIQSSLAEVGVNVTIDRLPDAQFFEQLNAHQLPFFIHDWYSWGNDPSYQLSFLLKCGQFTNYADYCNEQVDELIETTAWSLDEDVREEGMREAQQIVIDDAPWAFLYQPNWIVAANKDFYGFARFDDLCLRFAYMGKKAE